jgi:hypothetical protein
VGGFYSDGLFFEGFGVFDVLALWLVLCLLLNGFVVVGRLLVKDLEVVRLFGYDRGSYIAFDYEALFVDVVGH